MGPASSKGARFVLGLALGLSVAALAMQLVWVRPHLWPAGSTVLLSGHTVFASLAAPQPVVRIRPPDVRAVAGTSVTIVAAPPFSPAPLAPGPLGRPPLLAADDLVTLVTAIVPAAGPPIDVAAGLPADAAGVLRVWREAHRLGVRDPIALRVRRDGVERTVEVARPAVWAVADPAVRASWLRRHAGPLLQMAAFLAGALMLVALGARGRTADLMTLALMTTAVANGGPLLGAQTDLPVVGGLALLTVWLATPLAFPIVGLAILHFPSRAPILDRVSWIPVALAATSLPMLATSLFAALFLLGADGVLTPLAALAAQPWLFDASFAAALAANVLIVIEGVGRYRRNPDVTERRRIQIVVYTGVPAVLAYALVAGVPVVASLAGRPVALPWPIQLALQALILLPAFALPYAVAVKRVFSPRTVLRRGLQYALARRTLSLLILLPLGTLLVAILGDRDRPLADVVRSQPLFYGVSVGLAVIAFRFRVRAQQWLDRRFFRAEYDAREILVSLADRVSQEPDATRLVSRVVGDVDSALHPESMAVLAGDGTRLEVVAHLRSTVTPLPRDSALMTMLRWSDKPLEIHLDDDRAPDLRLPPDDRRWLAAGRVSLLVPIFGGTGDGRTLAALIALGPRQSEEPYTPEDRRLLHGIAGQMGVALDLSRLRRQLSSGGARVEASERGTSRADAGGPDRDRRAATIEGEAVPATLGACPTCQRCVELQTAPTAGGVAQCPDDESPLQPLVGIPALVDGKYRVDAVIGRGGMGAVFRAHDVRLGRDVAIKTVNAELVADAVSKARFEREAQVVARLQHPAIVTVFDYGALPHGAAFLVMEFIAGEDLRRVLAREKTLPPERALMLVEQIAAGVDAAHQAGVLHRDLKPENILLPAGGGGAKVVDFGVAKVLAPGTRDASGTLTQSATLVGTPAYMSPEQLRGEALDGRADVYGLAALTYEMLTGRLPFGAGSFFDIGLKQAAGGSALDDGTLPPAVAAALRDALAIDREDRPATAGVFAERLRVRPASPPAR